MHDLVLRGGRLFDGTGAPDRIADVAVRDGRIAAVGRVGPGKREIACAGAWVTPGFVDVHTHYDAQATWDPELGPSSWHGVTTVVMGNCGVGFAPARPDRHDWLIGLMEGVEDIPGSAMTEGIPWGWESFPEYLDVLDAMPRAVDVATQVPHGALRAYVMGERGAANAPATEADRVEMARLVEQALRAGAFGVSTSRTSLHRSIDGELVPGTTADRHELLALAGALNRVGRGVFQLAAEHMMVPAELSWMREIAATTGRTVCFNLSQTDFGPTLWRDVLGQLEAMPADLPVVCQVAGRAIGVLMGWRLTAHPFARHPTFLELSKRPWPELRAALARPEVRERLLTERPGPLSPFEQFVSQSFHKMFPFVGDGDYEPAPSTSVAAVALATGADPKSVAYDALMADDGEGLLYFPLFNYADGSLDLLHTLHQHPRTRMGLSDGGAHCGAICDGGMPTFMLGFWGMGRERGPRLELPWLIHRQTAQTADLYGLADRGRITPGLRADLNVIDPSRLRAPRPELVFDLPAGGRRLVQRSRGYVATFVQGVQTFDDGAPTGERPGRLVRAG